MEATIRKLQKKFRRAREEMAAWDELQSRLLSYFGNASSIINRLKVIEDAKNYGALRCIPGIREELLAKQLVTLEMTLLSMRGSMNEFYKLVASLNKIVQDASQIVKEESASTKKMKLRIGIWPSLEDCLNGLKEIAEMHESEYTLKNSVIDSLTWKLSSDDITALQQILVDQPNIHKDEVQEIFERIFAEEIS